MDDIWLDQALQSIPHYRSTYQQQLQERIYGTSHPVALVTGSASARVGNHVARYLLCHGYQVVFHARSSVAAGQRLVEACHAAGLSSMLVQGDVSDEVAVGRWMSEIKTKFGRLDVVVHCAASWDRKSLEATTAQDVIENLSNHTLGAFLVAQHAGLMMCEQTTGGSIVLTGDWAVQRPYAGFSAYFAGKASIPTLTKTFAVELGSRNPRVRTNCILPGIVLLGGERNESDQRQLEQAAIVQRLGTPWDIAQAALFLSENTFITGESLNVDGGRHCYAGPGVDEIAHPDHG